MPCRCVKTSDRLFKVPFEFSPKNKATLIDLCSLGFGCFVETLPGAKFVKTEIKLLQCPLYALHHNESFVWSLECNVLICFTCLSQHVKIYEILQKTTPLHHKQDL